MSLILKGNNLNLWMHLIQDAEKECVASLSGELEYYLASLLDRYLNQSDIATRVFASAYLEAMQRKAREREVLLQAVGDECLLYAGLYPLQTERRTVSTDYFIKLGCQAYKRVSHRANDLCSMLASQFVLLTDILQTMRQEPALLPMEAYDRWQKTGSQRAYKMLLLYTNRNPLK